MPWSGSRTLRSTCRLRDPSRARLATSAGRQTFTTRRCVGGPPFFLSFFFYSFFHKTLGGPACRRCGVALVFLLACVLGLFWFFFFVFLVFCFFELERMAWINDQQCDACVCVCVCVIVVVTVGVYAADCAGDAAGTVPVCGCLCRPVLTDSVGLCCRLLELCLPALACVLSTAFAPVCCRLRLLLCAVDCA
jgi:hypothetical protein